jgi:hypothetical protein
MDEFNTASHRRGEADAVVGAVHVVIHGLRDANHWHTFLVQPDSITQRVIAADRQQDINTQLLDDAQHMRRAIDRAFAVAAELAPQEIGETRCSHLSRVGT